MAKFTVPKIEANTFKGWLFVVVLGVALGLVALFAERGGIGSATGATGCTMTVLADDLYIRSTPNAQLGAVGTLHRGETVDALPTVVDGYRQLLGTNRWALNESLSATPGSRC